MFYSKVKNVAQYSLVATVLTAFLALSAYMVLEPRVTIAQQSFTITQTISDALAFATPPGNVNMVGPINGVSGGNATGTTYTVITTNDPDGYNMTIAFDNATSSMRGNQTDSQAIRDYVPVSANTPDFKFNASTSALFGYTVTASTTSDVDGRFLYDGGDLCNNGGSDKTDEDTCYFRPSDAAVTIINRSTSANTGATTTIRFKVNVPNAPVPAVEADVYTATATLTAVNN